RVPAGAVGERIDDSVHLAAGERRPLLVGGEKRARGVDLELEPALDHRRVLGHHLDDAVADIVRRELVRDAQRLGRGRNGEREAERDTESRASRLSKGHRFLPECCSCCGLSGLSERVATCGNTDKAFLYTRMAIRYTHGKGRSGHACMAEGREERVTGGVRPTRATEIVQELEQDILNGVLRPGD